MQIEPQFTLPLIYELTDPFDSSTYYIQSVIRDSLTGDILDTINLTSQGSGRYSSTVYPPQDSTGFGRHIDVTISVYTDSNYSIYSDVYQKKIDKYIVKASKQSFGGGGGAEVDYDKIRKIIKEVLESKEDEVEVEQIDFTPIYERFEVIKGMIGSIEIPKLKEFDDSSILSAIGGMSKRLSTKIDDKEVTKVKDINLSPLINLLTETKNIISGFDEKIEEIKDSNAKNTDSITQAIKEINDIEETIKSSDAKVQKIKDTAMGMFGEFLDKGATERDRSSDNKILQKYL